jgi:hypothetical protein
MVGYMVSKMLSDCETSRLIEGTSGDEQKGPNS